MHPQIHIRNLNINLRAPQAQAHASPIPALLLAALASERTPQPEPAPAIALPAAIGAELQGGIYTGPMVEDGKLIHLIRATESLGNAHWDTAKEEANKYRGGGLDDWYLPPHPEMLIALAHDQDGFEKVWHWTSTPYGQLTAWAVDFEDGLVNTTNRRREVRVRPFRRFIP
jgi:hypothetical protein